MDGAGGTGADDGGGTCGLRADLDARGSQQRPSQDKACVRERGSAAMVVAVGEDDEQDIGVYASAGDATNARSRPSNLLVIPNRWRWTETSTKHRDA